MKKTSILLSVLISASLSVYSQTIPNNGFETWAITPPAPFESAEGWVGGPSISKSTNAHSGSFALQLETAVFTNPNNGETDTIPGNAFTGAPGAGPGMPGTPGFAFTNRPDSLTGWYTYSSVGNDVNEIRVTFSRWDAISLQREEIANSVFSCNPSDIYTRFSFPIQYSSSNTPDTASIEIRSSNSPMETPILGSILLVDDFEFTSTDQTGFSHIETSPSFRIFPNPANDFLNVSSKNKGQIKIINALGQTMESIQLNAISNIRISTSKYPNGIYFIVNEGKFSSKFIVNHSL
jgi:hypothetical protein